MEIGNKYIEIKTGKEWKLVDIGYFDVELENVNITYCVSIGEFESEFRQK